jgi:hypothetical protein
LNIYRWDGRPFLARGWNVIATMRSPKPMPFEDSDRLLVTELDVKDFKRHCQAVPHARATINRRLAFLKSY